MLLPLTLLLQLGISFGLLLGGQIDVEGLCEECDTTTGSGYVAHPKYCHLFIHCVLGTDSIVGRIKECTRGTLWSQTYKQCVWPDESDCPHNPCVNSSNVIKDFRLCNGYFTCPTGHALKHNCCPEFQRYDEASRTCVPDPQCKDDCLPGSAKDQNKKAPACDKVVLPGNKRRYLWMTKEGNITMDCAAGTAYSQESCSCTESAAIEDVPCEPWIYFPFDKNVKDAMSRTASGGSDAWIKNTEPASVGGGAAYFDGRRRVIAWAMNNMEFGSNFTLSFRFKPELPKRPQDRFALVDNSDCDKEATFGVALLRQSDRQVTVHGGFRLKNGEAVTTGSEGLEMNKWHEVVLLKAGPHTELWVNNKIYTIAGKGMEANIERVDCAMNIGRGTGLENYVGYIDEVKFYKCVPKKYLGQ